jgi:hypothetical protein
MNERMIGAGHVARMGQMWNAYKILGDLSVDGG